VLHGGLESVANKPPAKSGRSSRLAWFLVAVLGLLLVLAGAWIAYMLYAERHVAVTLSAEERQVLDAKLGQLRAAARRDERSGPPPSEAPATVRKDGALVPEVYAEDPERRRVRFTERELNAIIARDPALAGRAAVRLSPGQVSASFLVDVPEDMPLLGGRRLRVQTGLRLVTEEGRVQAWLLGVSVGGIPVPTAWLGGLKGADLLATSGLGGLGEGIESLQVSEGALDLLLAP
jgi:hypothetical protein